MIIPCTLATVSVYIPKRKPGFGSKVCVSVGIGALFITAHGWNQPASPQTEEKTNKCGLFIHLALKEGKQSST